MAVSLSEFRDHKRQQANLSPLGERLAPSNVDAEQAVLGSLLLDRDAVLVAGEILDPDDFFRDGHRVTFEAMLRLRGQGKPADIVTVTNELERVGHLTVAGGVPYIHSLATVVPTAIHVAHYAGIVREMSQKRRLLSAAGRIGALAYDGETAAADGIAQAAGLIRGLLDTKQQRGGHIAVVRVPKEFLERPVPSPFPRLNDALHGGFRPGVSYVVAAPPGGLKTSWIVAVELEALRRDYGVCHITNELPAYVMRERYLANYGGYSFGRALRGGLYAWEHDQRETATGVLDQMPLFVWESVPSVEEIGLRLANVKAQRPEAQGWLLVVDYIQRLESDARMDLHRATSRNFDHLQTISRNEQAALILASSLPKSEWQLDPDQWGGKDSGDVLGYTSVFLGLQRHKERDRQDEHRDWCLGLTAWLTKNTLGMTTQIDYTVHGPSQRWTEEV